MKGLGLIREHHPLVWWLYLLGFQNETISPTPPPLCSCGLWSGSCRLHEVYGFCIEGFWQLIEGLEQFIEDFKKVYKGVWLLEN